MHFASSPSVLVPEATAVLHDTPPSPGDAFVTGCEFTEYVAERSGGRRHGVRRVDSLATVSTAWSGSIEGQEHHVSVGIPGRLGSMSDCLNGTGVES